MKGNIDWPEIPKLMATAVGYQPRHGSGALTVFFDSVVTVERCTFTGNFNGVDDMGTGSRYSKCIFWNNTLDGGVRAGGRYELNVKTGTVVGGCHINGDIDDLLGTVDESANTLDCDDPAFDEAFVPTHSMFLGVGFRPTGPSGN